MNSIVAAKGSILQYAEEQGIEMADVFAQNVSVIVIVDTSSSMVTRDARGGKMSRLQAATEELAALQGRYPGQVALIAFNDEVIACPSGILPQAAGTTDVASALQFAREFDVPGMTFVLISDGEPNNSVSAIEQASMFNTPIHTIYVGGDDHGQRFLAQIANATHGATSIAELTEGLAQIVESRMLTTREANSPQ